MNLHNELLMYANIFLLIMQIIAGIKMVIDRNTLSREIENYHNSISTLKLKK